VKLSIIVPAYNEAQNLPETIHKFYKAVKAAGISHEILVINDNSSDETVNILEKLKKEIDTFRYITNPPPKNGYGYAVRKGLENFEGDCVAIVMADMSDSPKDLISFYNKMKNENLDCVFGSRFIPGGKTTDYPKNKYIINRIANTLVRLVFGLRVVL